MDQEGIAFSPARVNPLESLQVADFSNVQYLQIVDSEEELEDKGT